MFGFEIKGLGSAPKLGVEVFFQNAVGAAHARGCGQAGLLQIMQGGLQKPCAKVPVAVFVKDAGAGEQVNVGIRAGEIERSTHSPFAVKHKQAAVVFDFPKARGGFGEMPFEHGTGFAKRTVQRGAFGQHLGDGAVVLGHGRPQHKG